ncbi:phosphatase PAP2 family protein [Pueribacillus sp. YX66]|uniref:phosphatase PAP2 family protein n=1 Tax=Pueribacillus sp. YX66 TaxID=3229242 RepID=UPI00358CF94D
MARSTFLHIVGVSIFLLSMFIFLYLSYLLTKQPVLKIDTYIFSLVDAFSNNISFTKFFNLITNAGSPFILQLLVILIGLLLLLVKRDLFSSLFIFLVPTVGLLMNRGLKYVYGRERPTINPAVEGTGFSFPSGHATGSIVFYGSLIYLVVRSHSTSSLKWLFSLISFIVILFIGLSRIYVNVHYPSDVLGGYAFGLTFLMGSIFIFEWIFALRQRRR